MLLNRHLCRSVAISPNLASSLQLERGRSSWLTAGVLHEIRDLAVERLSRMVPQGLDDTAAVYSTQRIDQVQTTPTENGVDSLLFPQLRPLTTYSVESFVSCT